MIWSNPELSDEINPTPQPAEEQFAAMAIDEDSDEEDDESSVDEQPQSSNKCPGALFLNFTSDLSPQKMNKKKSKPKKQTAYRVNGVNILNRNNLDSKTAIERIQRRRENHNHVERRRRDNINNTIFELSRVVPNAIQSGQKPNKGNILKLALDYIKDLQAENQSLKSRLDEPVAASVPSSPLHSRVFVQGSQSMPSSPTHHGKSMGSSTSSASSSSSSSISSVSSGLVEENPAAVAAMLPPPLSLPPQMNFSMTRPVGSSPTTPSVAAVYPATIATAVATAATAPMTPVSAHYPHSYPTTPVVGAVLMPNNNHGYYDIPQPAKSASSVTSTVHPPALRPLLPATKQPYSPSGPSPTTYYPPLRMSGYEKIYGSVCRY
ncbi:hypothetical protein DFQ28_002502 [Apophysomyces sp. BC1034]|nr:hypothetical protein DFQ30_001235 [Apophysomyces sp. BC1015]KAG0178475.1 hypothetical protein DFQ29_003414 [Apophysomyces sp. BC1021]KAG0190090.1 hypothetical protein DFQ28_002502 [Apophysomyces sp. BC1034]